MSLRVGQRVTTIDGREGELHHRTWNRPGEYEVWAKDGTFTYLEWQLAPLAGCSWLERVLLITYPELFICSKAGECGEKYCVHKAKHAHGYHCDMLPICREDATCIPYVPEDEAREWFIARKGALSLFTEQEAIERVRSTTSYPGYRAFKWSQGLKGGE